MNALLPTRRAIVGGGVGLAVHGLWPPAFAAGADALSLSADLLEAPFNAPYAFSHAPGGVAARLQRGAAQTVRFSNQLGGPVGLQTCGLRLAIAAACAPVAPGQNRDLAWMAPDSGFGLLLGRTAGGEREARAGGLVGAIIVAGDKPPEADADILAILQDGSPATYTFGGAAVPAAFALPPRSRVRLRLANATAGLLASILIEGAQPGIIAVDSQPCPLFQPLRNQFPLAPLARFELMFDLPDAGAAVTFSLAGAPGVATKPLAIFTAIGDPAPTRGPIAALPENPLLPAEIALQRAHRVEVAIEGAGERFSIGKGDPARPLFQVRRGEPVTLAYLNKTPVTQALRLPGHVGRLLHGLDDGWDPYWRDVVLVAPGKTALLAFIADNPGAWRLESAIAEHLDKGVSASFVVG